MLFKNNLSPAIIGRLLLVCSCTFQCTNPSTKPTAWRKLDCGLYLSPEGELGFATDPEIANVPKSELEPERCENAFITHIGTDGKIPLVSVIDTLTFEALGSGFYKDKANIYSHYAICEGGYLNIVSKDTSGFRVQEADAAGR